MDGVARKASEWKDRVVLRLIYMRGVPAYDTPAPAVRAAAADRTHRDSGRKILRSEMLSMTQKAADNLKVALAVMQRGMSIEQIGRAFYLRASQTTRDEGGRESFIDLAEDEQTHYNLLKRQYDSLTREGGWLSAPEVKSVGINLNQRLFPVGRQEIERAVNVKSSDWDALLFGMDIEIKSFDLYRKAALETADIRGRGMFEWLAAQESSHFDVLMMRYDFLYGPVAWHP